MMVRPSREERSRPARTRLAKCVESIAVASFGLLLTTKLDTLWIILGAALISLSASSLGLIQQH
jgi:hypothetical protein